MHALFFDRTIYVLFGNLLRQPGADFAAQTATLEASLPEAFEEARAALGRFRAAITPLGRDALEELHARTFDIMPMCVPYLSVHLFGEESFKRSELMLGLLDAYARSGWKLQGELPDHVGVVLQFAPQFPPEEWEELVEWCLTGPVGRMAGILEKKDNPYGHLFRAVHSVLQRTCGKEAIHA